MAYTEQDRALLRHYLGFGAIFLQAEPRAENAISATQSLAEGGTRPDSNTENYIKGLIYGATAQVGVTVAPGPAATNTAFAMPATIGLLAIEQQISTLWPIAFVNSADNGEAKIDTYRAMVQLRSEGRRLCYSIARMLGMRGVRADVFSPGEVIVNDNPFAYDSAVYDGWSPN